MEMDFNIDTLGIYRYVNLLIWSLQFAIFLRRISKYHRKGFGLF